MKSSACLRPEFVEASFSVSCRYLKPDENKKSKHKTAVKKKTLNPEFNEVKSTTTHVLSQPRLLLQTDVVFTSPYHPLSNPQL